MVKLKGRPWLQTSKGNAWCADDPESYPYDVEEIAHALSNTCRFGGHTKEFYSVAQHSVLVAELMRWTARPERRAALLHDASEAFCLDVPAPIKRMEGMGEYRAWEKRVERSIMWWFGLEGTAHRVKADIKHADLRALATEKRDVMGPSPHHTMWLETEDGSLPPPDTRVIKILTPKQARAAFMRAWERYSK